MRVLVRPIRRQQELSPALWVDQGGHHGEAMAGVDVGASRPVLVGCRVAPGQRVNLNVRDRCVFLTLDEGACFEHRATEPAVAEQVLGQHPPEEMKRGSAVETRGRAIGDRHEQVVVQVLADSREVNLDVDPVAPQVLGWADTGEHQQLRRTDLRRPTGSPLGLPPRRESRPAGGTPPRRPGRPR